MKRPCVVDPKPQEELIYVTDSATVPECASIFHKKRVGALLVKSDSDSRLVGIMSERDFIKALATDTAMSSRVKDLMTPFERMVTVSLTTGVGECMELMRQHNIRHLPVMATQTGEDKNQALVNMTSVVERAESNARKQLTPFKTKLCDALGEARGKEFFAQILSTDDLDSFSKDERPLVQRAAAAAAKLRDAEARLATVNAQSTAMQESHPVGIISIRDLLLAMTANQVMPLLDWLVEERRTLIEERVGYSE